MKSFAILGLGRFGAELALALARGGAEVLAVDRERKPVEFVADEVTRAVTCNIRDKDALGEIGVAECDCAVLCVGGDLAASVLGLMNLKALGVKKIICKAYDETYREVLLKLGADQVVIPEKEMADKLATNLISPSLKDYIALSDSDSLEEVTVPSSWIGKSLADLRIRNRYKAEVIAVRRGGKTIITPSGEEGFLPGDVLVILGDKENLADIRRLK